MENSNTDKIIADAINRYHREGKVGIDWTYMWMNAQQKKDFDDFLMCIKHQLAYEPGTNERRFEKYIVEQCSKR